MSLVILDYGQLEALARARDGYVFMVRGAFDPFCTGPVLVYDSLNTLPEGAIQVLYNELLGWGLVEVAGDAVSITDAGLVAHGTGRLVTSD